MLGRRLTLILSSLLVLLNLLVSNASATVKKETGLTLPRTYADMLLDDARTRRGAEAMELIKRSLILFPENPEAYFLMAEKSPALLALRYFLKGMYYSVVETWHLININAILVLSIAVAIFASLSVFSILRMPTTAALIIHEIIEDPRKVIFMTLLIPSILGFYFTIAAFLFFILSYVRKKTPVAAVTLFVLMVLSLFTFRFFNSYLKTLLSPDTRAIISVNTGESYSGALAFLKKHDDRYSMFSYGLALLKMNRLEEAKDVYERLSGKLNDDRVLINLSGVNLLLGNLKEAEELLQRVLDRKPSVSAYYNMSIIKREQLDFQKGDDYFTRAINLDFDRVTLYRELLSSEHLPMPMVETLKKPELLTIIISRTMKGIRADRKALVLPIYTVLLLILLALRQRKGKIPVKCKKCGKIYCPVCERRVSWRDICSDCFKNLVTLERNPEERIRTLLKTYEYQRKRRQILNLLSFLIPGYAILMSDRFARGVVIFSSIVFLLSIVFISGYFKVNIPSSDFLVLRLSSLALSIIIYVFTLLYVRKRVRKGWL